MKNKIKEFLNKNWFRLIILILVSFAILKGLVFTPQNSYNKKKEECLEVMKKFEIYYKEMSRGELKSEEIYNELYTTKDPDRVGNCQIFLEAENINYPLRNDWNLPSRF